jgi:hypothetical protein
MEYAEMASTDNIFLRNHTIKYNMIFSDEEWKKFHAMVKSVMGLDLALPELLAVYNKLPEYVQSGLMRIGFVGVEYHLSKLMGDEAFQSDFLTPLSDKSTNILPFKR